VFIVAIGNQQSLFGTVGDNM